LLTIVCVALLDRFIVRTLWIFVGCTPVLCQVSMVLACRASLVSDSLDRRAEEY
jgi:hypothetical protein